MQASTFDRLFGVAPNCFFPWHVLVLVPPRLIITTGQFWGARFKPVRSVLILKQLNAQLSTPITLIPYSFILHKSPCIQLSMCVLPGL